MRKFAVKFSVTGYVNLEDKNILEAIKPTTKAHKVDEYIILRIAENIIQKDLEEKLSNNEGYMPFELKFESTEELEQI